MAGTVSAYDPADLTSVTPFASVPNAAALAIDPQGRMYVTSYDIQSQTGSLVFLNLVGEIADS